MDEYTSGFDYIGKRSLMWERLSLDDLEKMVYAFAAIGNKGSYGNAVGMAEALFEVLDKRRYAA